MGFRVEVVVDIFLNEFLQRYLHLLYYEPDVV